MPRPRSATPKAGNVCHDSCDAVGCSGSAQESDSSVRLMNLKVHYTFDAEAQINCLARLPYALKVRTTSINETSTIGIVDLRSCLCAVLECSPELAQNIDYNIYAYDYSELEVPLVGQGMLSRALESMRGPNPPALYGRQDMGRNQRDPYHQVDKFVTGRVSSNVSSFFDPSKETVEVKLKFTPSSVPPPRPTEGFKDYLPRDLTTREKTIAELLEAIQGNQICQTTSPGYPPVARACMGNTQEQTKAVQQDAPQGPQQLQRAAPVLSDISEQPMNASRPSSRQSNKPGRQKTSTGRPRGRPPKSSKKRPCDDNTSGCEGPREAEQAHVAKRGRVEKAAVNPFTAEPSSLRVMASTSASLRSVRPVATSSDNMASRRQPEVCRAPTPVPEKGASGPMHGRRALAPVDARRPSALSQQTTENSIPTAETGLRYCSPSLDDGQPPDYGTPTPGRSDAASMCSSPPMQPQARFMRSTSMALPSSPPMLPMAPLVTSDCQGPLDNLARNGPPAQANVPSHNLPPNAPLNPTEQKMEHGASFHVFQVQQNPDAPRKPRAQPQRPPAPSEYQAISEEPTQPAIADQALVSSVDFQAPDDGSCQPFCGKDTPQTQQECAPVKGKSLLASPTFRPHPPCMQPTPPPTTDAAEQPSSSMGLVLVEPVSQPDGAYEHGDSVDDLDLDWAEELFQADLSREQSVVSEACAGNEQSDDTTTVGLCLPTTGPEEASLAHQVPDESAKSDVLPVGIEAKNANSPAESAMVPQKRISPTNVETRCSQPLVRSQSTGGIGLPSNAGSKPQGPRQSEAVHQACLALPALPRNQRASSLGALALPVPEPTSDAVNADQQASNMTRSSAAKTGRGATRRAALSPSVRSNKNVVKKIAIKQRLEEAINNGELPPYCTNCGEIVTPTWRKIWVQIRKGIPDYYEYSEKPGKVTAIEILKRDADDKPTLYRMIKKGLSPDDDRSIWDERLLCNPCGIWLTKCKAQRPPDRWDKDLSRPNQSRRRRGGGGRGNPRPKKPQSTSEAQMAPTSEQCAPTEAPMPDQACLPEANANQPSTWSQHGVKSIEQGQDSAQQDDATGSGTKQNPVLIDEEAENKTQRQLFCSPTRDATPRVLMELDVNIVQNDQVELLAAAVQVSHAPGQHAVVEGNKEEAIETLSRGLDLARTCTPPPPSPKGKSNMSPPDPFKTPTRPTPNRRPITRSVTRSLRSSQRRTLSPSGFPVQTPTKVFFSTEGGNGSSCRGLDRDRDSLMIPTPPRPGSQCAWFGESLDNFMFTSDEGFAQLMDLGDAELEAALAPSSAESETGETPDLASCDCTRMIWDKNSTDPIDFWDMMEE